METETPPKGPPWDYYYYYYSYYYYYYYYYYSSYGCNYRPPTDRHLSMSI